jgi:hypothetical protein
MNADVMNIGEPDIENETAVREEYGDEVMYSGWNPQIAAAIELSFAAISNDKTLPAGLANADVDSFLKSMYEYLR